jgi:hypothetical protein
MTETRIEITKSKLVKAYGGGLLAFAAIVGSVTVIAIFLARLNFP